MKKIGLSIGLIISFIISFANQGDTTKYVLRFSGFVKADAIFDSRQNVTARDGFVLLYPQKPFLDKTGNDIYAQPQYNQYATSTRLIISIDSIKWKKGIISTNIETDFTGSSESTNSGLRLRHAYLKFDTEKFGFLAGQFWHPLVAPEIFPDMISLNLGNPFKSAMRCPQLRFRYTTGKFNWLAIASSQRDNSSIGANGSNSLYLQQQVIPSLHLQNIYKCKNFIFGSGVDFKRLLMRDKNGFGEKVSEYCTSYATHIFTKFKIKSIEIKSQIIWGQNLYEHSMLGGVRVYNIDTISNDYKFIPTQQISGWLQLSKKYKNFNFTIFTGYISNLGASKNIINSKIYSRGADIDFLYRISPQISYRSGKLLFISETEITTAAYGKNSSNYTVINSKLTSNIRENLSLIYLF